MLREYGGMRTMQPDGSTKMPTIALLGAGRLASNLAPALRHAGFRITEIVARPKASSVKKARSLARAVQACAVSLATATLDADVLWLAVPDREIRNTAETLGRRVGPMPRVVLHASGALSSHELEALRVRGVAVASAHPLMTFVAASRPSLKDVPFAVEGDPPAVRIARQIVRALGGQSVLLSKHKVAYHAWATMTSPLLLAYLVALEHAAQNAGISPLRARRMSAPIIHQTLENYQTLGPAASFSGPFVRGDAETVRRHLASLEKNPDLRNVYCALARVAITSLPVRNRKLLVQLLQIGL